MDVDKTFKKCKYWNSAPKPNEISDDKGEFLKPLYHPTKAGFLVYFKVCDEDNTVKWTPEAILNTGDNDFSKHKTILGKYVDWLLCISKKITINY